MGISNTLNNQTVAVVILVSSIFTTFFYFILFAANRRRSLFYLLLANFIQIVFMVMILILSITGELWTVVIATALTVPVTSLWAYSIFDIMDIKTGKVFLIIINIVNTIFSVTTYLVFKDVHYSNVASSLSVYIVSAFCALHVYMNKYKDEKKEAQHVIGLFGIFGIFNLARSIYRLINPLDYTSFDAINESAALIVLVCYGFSFVVNYTVLFLSFSKLLNKVKRLSNIDNLTGVFSRSTFFVMLSQKLSDLKRGGKKVCVALLDIDDFKRVNDTYGHLEGDRVLAEFAKALKESLRENDIVGRYGGEEFMLLLDVDTAEEALSALDRIKDSVTNKLYLANERITFSCGHVFLKNGEEGSSINEILEDIDSKMYLAKSYGKNRIV